jgi:hypothetical protein
MLKRLVDRSRLILALSLCVFPTATLSQERAHEDEIVANMAGGRVIVHVANERIIFGAIDQPVEANSIPPRVVDLDRGHIGVLLGASEWRVPADPKPIRMDKDFRRVTAQDPRYEAYPGDAEPDLETIGIAYLEKLRPLVSQLHRKLDFPADEPIFQVVIIGYAPKGYGPEVWVAEYRIEQEQVATRGEYWQTRILRPRFMQLYPPEKHEPHTLVESRYPPASKGPTLRELIQGHDPRVQGLNAAPRMEKVLENIRGGTAQKASAADATEFMKSALPLIANNAHYILGTLEEQRGFEWVVPPDEPVQKAEEDKNRPPEAPSLLRKPKP